MEDVCIISSVIDVFKIERFAEMYILTIICLVLLSFLIFGHFLILIFLQLVGTDFFGDVYHFPREGREVVGLLDEDFLEFCIALSFMFIIPLAVSRLKKHLSTFGR